MRPLPLGKVLRATRERRKLSQRQLSELTGMSRQFLSRTENGRTKTTIDTLVKLCAGLQCDVWQVVQAAESRAKARESRIAMGKEGSA